MTVLSRTSAALVALAVCAPVGVAAERGARDVRASAAEEMPYWEAALARSLDEGSLRVRQVREDTLIAGREHARLAQFHRGVPVFGGELVVQTEAGRARTVFGTLYEGIEIGALPALTADQALRAVARRGFAPVGSDAGPELLVLAREQDFPLAYRLRAMATAGVQINMFFVDAKTGEIALEYNDLKSQAVGRGTGVLNDEKKLSTRPEGGAFLADDRLRPPVIATYDMKGDLFRAISALNSSAPSSSDLASDGRQRLERRPQRRRARVPRLGLRLLLPPLRPPRARQRQPADPRHHASGAARGRVPVSEQPVPRALLQRFLPGRRADGLRRGAAVPDRRPDLRLPGGRPGRRRPRADARRDRLHVAPDLPERIGRVERGGLRHHGNRGRVLLPGARKRPAARRVRHGRGRRPAGRRAFDAEPARLRRPGPLQHPLHGDAGQRRRPHQLGHRQPRLLPGDRGRHHRVSGQSVQGVGVANREQMERVFYRAFTTLLTPSATFSQARAATIQAARDLFGAASAPERAVTHA